MPSRRSPLASRRLHLYPTYVAFKWMNWIRERTKCCFCRRHKNAKVGECKECPICFENIMYEGPLPCGHIFHEHCIIAWQETCYSNRSKPTCPVCRSSLPFFLIFQPSTSDSEYWNIKLARRGRKFDMFFNYQVL